MKSLLLVACVAVAVACAPEPAGTDAAYQDAVRDRLTLLRRERREFAQSLACPTLLGPHAAAVQAVTPGPTKPVWVRRLGERHVVLGLNARGTLTMTLPLDSVLWAGDPADVPDPFDDD